MGDWQYWRSDCATHCAPQLGFAPHSDASRGLRRRTNRCLRSQARNLYVLDAGEAWALALRGEQVECRGTSARRYSGTAACSCRRETTLKEQVYSFH